MKICPITFVLAVVGMTAVVKAQEVETFDCYADDVMVTDKESCDTWCGGVGKYTGEYVDGDFTGLTCECTDANDPNAAPATKECKGTYVVPNCYDEGVKNKATCDEWCGGLGSYTGSLAGSTFLGLRCDCTDKNDPGAAPTTQWCKAEYVTPSCASVNVTSCDGCGDACEISGVGVGNNVEPFCTVEGDKIGCRCGSSEDSAVFACNDGVSSANGRTVIIAGVAAILSTMFMTML